MAVLERVLVVGLAGVMLGVLAAGIFRFVCALVRIGWREVTGPRSLADPPGQVPQHEKEADPPEGPRGAAR